MCAFLPTKGFGFLKAKTSLPYHTYNLYIGIGMVKLTYIYTGVEVWGYSMIPYLHLYRCRYGIPYYTYTYTGVGMVWLTIPTIPTPIQVVVQVWYGMPYLHLYRCRCGMDSHTIPTSIQM